jgi:5-methylcytosine-specific restriction endonuclease McrA
MSPSALPHSCSIAGCPERAGSGGRCPAHQRPVNRQQHQGIYDTAKHRTWRRMVLARHPICEGWPPGCHGLAVVPSVVADHIVPLSEGGGWVLSNGAGMCISCHNRKTNEEQTQKERR